MKPITLEWVEKADGDFGIAGRELRSRTRPFYDGVCFHAQQCVEKYLKAFLQENGQPVPKIHQLAELMFLTAQVDPSFQLLQPDLATLEDYAVSFRYPGAAQIKRMPKTPTKPQAECANLFASGLVCPTDPSRPQLSLTETNPLFQP